jgi:hypothetical protein
MTPFWRMLTFKCSGARRRLRDVGQALTTSRAHARVGVQPRGGEAVLAFPIQ